MTFARGGEELFRTEVPETAEIEGDVAIGSYLHDVASHPDVVGAVLIEIADETPDGLTARWGYFIHVINGELTLSETLPSFVLEEIEDEVRV